MKKDELIELLNKMNLPTGEYWDTPCSGLVLYHVREQSLMTDLESLPLVPCNPLKIDQPFRTADEETNAASEPWLALATEDWFMNEILSQGNILEFPGEVPSVPGSNAPKKRLRIWNKRRLIDTYLRNTLQH